jgi:hypothetical protein
VELVGAEVFALVLARIGDISREVSCCWLRSSWSSDDVVIDAGIVISCVKISSEISPLESPLSVGQVARNCQVDLAWKAIVRVVCLSWVCRTASSNLFAHHLEHCSIERRVQIAGGKWRPGKTNESTCMGVSNPLDINCIASVDVCWTYDGVGNCPVAGTPTGWVSFSSISACCLEYCLISSTWRSE